MIKNLIKKFALLGAFVSLTVSSAWAATVRYNGVDITYSGTCATSETDGDLVMQFTSDGSLELPERTTADGWVLVVGGGASGTKSGRNNRYGGSGGGGKAAENKSLALKAGVTYSITVGAAQTTTSADGNPSSFSGSGITTLTGNGGTASSTTDNRTGVAGTGGYNTANSITGSSVTYGQNGAAATSQSSGGEGTGIGGGGVGGYSSGNGGNGTAGIVIVRISNLVVEQDPAEGTTSGEVTAYGDDVVTYTTENDWANMRLVYDASLVNATVSPAGDPAEQKGVVTILGLAEAEATTVKLYSGETLVKTITVKVNKNEKVESITLMASETTEITTGEKVALKWVANPDELAGERLTIKTERQVDSSAKVTITANGTAAAAKPAVIALYGDNVLVKLINVTITEKVDKNYMAENKTNSTERLVVNVKDARVIHVGETWEYTTATKGNGTWTISNHTDTYKSYNLSSFDSYFTIGGTTTTGNTSRNLKKNEDGTTTFSITGKDSAGDKALVFSIKNGNTEVMRVQVIVDGKYEDIKIKRGETVRRSGEYNSTGNDRRWAFDNDGSGNNVVALAMKYGEDSAVNTPLDNCPYKSGFYQTKNWNQNFNADLTGKNLGSQLIRVARVNNSESSFSTMYQYNVFVYEEETDSIDCKAGDVITDKEFTSEKKGAWEATSDDPTIVTVTEAGWTSTSFKPVIKALKEGTATLTVKNNFITYLVAVKVAKGKEIKNISIEKGGEAYVDNTIAGGASASSDDEGVATIKLDGATKATITGKAAGDALCTVYDDGANPIYEYNVKVYETKTADALVATGKTATVSLTSAKPAVWTVTAYDATVVQVLTPSSGEATDAFSLQLKGLDVGRTTVRVENDYVKYAVDVLVSGDVKKIEQTVKLGETITTNLTFGSAVYWVAKAASDGDAEVMTVEVDEKKSASMTAKITTLKPGLSQWTIYVNNSEGDELVPAYTLNVKVRGEVEFSLDMQRGAQITTNLTSEAQASWTAASSAPTVATVTATGASSTEFELKITALDNGETTVTAQNDYAVYTIHVKVSTIIAVPVPTAATGLVYDGTVQTGVATGDGYTLTGDASAKAAGDYEATATLEEGYCWDGGATDAKTIAWSIGYKAVTVTAVSTNKLFGAEDPTFTATRSVEPFAGDTLDYGVDRTNKTVEAVGVYTGVIVPTGVLTQESYAVTYVPGDFEIRRGQMTVDGKDYDDVDDAFDALADGGTATFNAAVIHGGYGFAAGATLAVADGAWTASALGVSNATVMVKDVTVNGKLTLGAGLTVGSDDAKATLAFAELEQLADSKITLTTNGTVRSTAKLEIATAFTEAPALHKILEESLDGGFEYTLIRLTVVDFPTVHENLVYTGSELRGVETGAGYTLTGDAVATNAGTYQVTAALDDDVRSVWEDMTTAPTNISWTIAQVTTTITAAPTSAAIYTGQPLSKSALTGGSTDGDVQGEFKWQDESHVPTNGEVCVVVFKPADAVNYTEATVTVTVEVWPRVGVPTAETLTYNGNEQTGVVARTGYTVTDNAKTDAGNYTATATLMSGYFWEDGTTHPTNVAWSIAKAQLGVAAVSTNKLFGAADPKPFTATVTGLCGTDTFTDYEVGRTNTSNEVGTYDLVFVKGDAELDNYTVSYTDGLFEIRRGQITVGDKDYDDVDKAFAAFGDGKTMTFNKDTLHDGYGFPAGTKLAAADGAWTVTGNLGVSNETAVVTNLAVSGRLTLGADVTVGSDDAVVTLKFAALSQLADSKLTLTTNGTVCSAAQLPIADVFTPAEALRRILETPVDGGYEYTLIVLKPITVPTAVTGLTYNGNEQTGVVAAAGFTLVDNAKTAAGEYTATATLDSGWVWKDDHATHATNVDWSIAFAQATVTADPSSKLSGNADPTFTATVTGTFGSDMLKYEVVRTNKSEEAGTYDLIASGALRQGSYDVSYVNGTFTIGAGKIVVNGVGYDDADKAFEALEDGGTATFNQSTTHDGYTFAQGSALTVDSTTKDWTVTLGLTVGTATVAKNITVSSGTLTLGCDTTVGTKDVQATLKFEELLADNHKITLTAGGKVLSKTQLDVETVFTPATDVYQWISETENDGYFAYVLADKEQINVPTAKTDLVYDGTEQTGVAEGTGYALTGNTAKKVGSYTATATLEDGYYWNGGSLDPTNIAWSIGLRSATVTAVSTNKLFGTEDPEFRTTVEGFIDTDETNLIWKVWRTNTCDEVGTYDLIVSGKVHQASYEITYVPGTFEIRTGAMTVTTNGVTRGYDDTEAAFAALFAAGGKAKFNETVEHDGYTFASGSTLTVNADGSWSTDGELSLAGDIYVPSKVTASSVVLAADLTVGVWTGKTATAELAILSFEEINTNSFKVALTTNGVVRSAKRLTTGFFVEPSAAYEVIETEIKDGGVWKYEYTAVLHGFTITFDSKGGSTVEPKVAAAGETVYGPENPTKTGYGFAYWYTNDTEEVTFPLTMPMEDLTLYAAWTANSYKVAYDPNGGEGQATTNDATYDAEFDLAGCDFTKRGYSFAGWTTNLQSAVRFQPGDSVSNLTAEADATVTMYATWTGNVYQVIYDANGGTGDPATSNATYDVEFKVSGNPGFAKTGYTFESWTNAAGDVFAIGASATNLTTSGAVTLYAAWAPNGYTLVYTAGEGEGVAVETNLTYDVRHTVIGKPDYFAKTGYSFAGWADGEDAVVTHQPGEDVVNLTNEPDAVVTWTAVWTANVYTVTFDPANGEDPFSFATNCDATIMAPENPTRTGYTFRYWSTNGVEVAFPITMPAGGLEVTALWDANEYSVEYNPNGGTGDLATSNATYDAEFEVVGQPFTKTGYTFESWTNAAGDVFAIGDKAKNLTAEPDGKVTLYAKWNPITYKLVYTANGGAGEDEERELTYDVAHKVIANPFARPGYGFAGWIDGEGASVTNLPGASVTNLTNEQGAVVTWLAAWAAGEFTLTFDPNGGNAVDPIVRKVGEAISAPQDPTRAWYEFDGWTTNGVKVVSFPTTMPGEDLTFVAQWTAAPGNPEKPWRIGPDGSDAVEAYVDPDLGRVVIRLNETNEIDLVALTNALVQAKVEINLDNFNAVVEVVDGTYMTPVSWSDTVDEKEPYSTLGDALKGATRFVCPNLSGEEPPAEIVEKRKTEDGETVTAVVVNDPSGGEANPIQVTAVTGLAEIAEEQKKDVTLRVAATNENTVGEATVWALMFANTNGLENVDGYQASYVDLSAKIGNAQVSDLGEGNVVTLFIPWTVDSRFIYRIARIHGDEPETIPEGEANKNEFGEYFEFVEGGIGLNVRRFSTYALAEIVAEQSGVAFIEVDDADMGVREGTNLVIRVTGGNRDFSSSVQLQVVYGTAKASDLDLKNAKVNGTLVSAFKFPYTLTWVNGEVWEQVIEIPVKVPSKATSNRDLTFALANPMNANLKGVDAPVANWSFRKVTILGDSGPVSGKFCVRATPNDATRGKASGSALVAEGKKVTVKATANKGYVFTGWFKGEELKDAAASYAFTPTEDIDLVARFEPLAADSLELKDDFLPAEIKLGEVFSNAVTVVSASLPTISVSGLPAGLKYYAKETVVKKTSKTPEYTVPANTIFGIPTKASATNKTSGVVTPSKVKVTVKNLGGYKVVRTYELRVTAQTTALGSAKVIGDDKPFAAVTVALSDGAAGKVTGAGLYQAGKKVTLKATANKGYVFAEWLEDGVNVSSNASYVINPMPSNNVSLVAKFVLPDEIKDPTGKNPYAVAVVRNNDFAGNVTGAGYYQAGKKVTLKATALKGYVFAGWATDDFTVTNQAASLTFTMGTEKVRAYARFVTAGEDLASIVTAVDGIVLPSTSGGTPLPLVTNVMCGVTLQWPVVSTALSLPKVAVSGLPSGLKFTAKDIMKKGSKTEVDVPANTIYGAPTAASKPGKPSKVKVTVTTSGKSKAEYQIDLTVDELPPYAVGTFDGPVFAADGTTNGVVKLTVAKNGKISGTIQTNCVNAAAKKLTLSVASFAALTNGVFYLKPTYKDGNATVEVPLTLDDSDAVVGEKKVGVIDGELLFAYQNVLKGVAQAEDFLEPDVTAKYPDLTLTVAKDGVLKVAGKVKDGSDKLISVSGSSQIYWDADEAGYRAVIYLPSKKGFDGVAEIVGFEKGL